MNVLVGFFDFIPQQIIIKLVSAGILALATLGIVLIYRTSFTTNFAQGSVAAFSAYIMYMVSEKLLAKFASGLLKTPLWIYLISLLVAVVAAFFIGFFIDAGIIRRAKKINSSGKQMITMGLVLVLTALTDIFFSPTIPRDIERIFAGRFTFKLFGLDLNITYHNLTVIITAVVVIVLIFVLLKHTKWGLSVRSTASNELVTQMMGVNTRMITALSWAIAGMLGTLAAVFYAPLQGQLSPGFMTSIQVNAFLALILGGATTFIGPVVASILIPLATAVISYFNGVWANVILYGLILLVILILPNGIFGKKIVKKV